jgi:hypothetical protein
MTGTELVTLVRTQVIEPNPAFFTSTALLNLLNAAQKNYVRRTRVLQNFATTSTVQGQADYPMPADWLGAEKIFYNNVQGGIDNWYALEPTSLEKLSQESPNFLSSAANMQGAPQKYYVINQTLFVYPKPATGGTSDIFMFYESKPVVLTALTDDLSIDDSLSDGLEAYLLWKMYKMDGEDTLATEQEQRYKEEVGEGRKWKKKRQLDGKYKIDIQSYMPFSYSSVNPSGINGLNPLNM